MRTNNANFEALNSQPQRELRLVVEIEFDASNKVYFTSHKDIPGLVGSVVQGCVRDLSSVSQKLDPINAVSSIGNINFTLVDKGGAVTEWFHAQDDFGRGLRGKTVRLYSGFRTLVWSDFRLEQTQVVSQSVTFTGTEYKVQCADVQRILRKDIFEPAKTKLASNFLAGATTMTVYDTSEFELNPHGPSYSDAPGTLASPVKVGYLKIKYDNGWEIVRYTGKTATTFTGITRGVFNTREVDHVIDGTPSAENGIDVEEFIYLELPAPKLLYALQTGVLLGQPGGSNTLPARWHCAVPTTFSDSAQYSGIGDAWYKASDDTGFIVRFDGLGKTDGKAFMEKEVCLLMGAFMPINGAGQLGLKLMQRVLSSSNYVAQVTPDDIIDAGDSLYSLSDVFNEFDIQWGYAQRPDKTEYFRRNILVDAVSKAKHGTSTPMALKFKGLQASRHTDSNVIQMFNGVRDRHAGPPIKRKLKLLPSRNNFEVGDTIRVTLPGIRDYTSANDHDRTYEVQGVSIDQSSQQVSVDLFGSTMEASAVADLQSGNVLPDAFYNSAGSALANVSGGNLTADTTVNGGTSLAATIRYVLGGLTIPAGTTLTLTGNVQLRVRGYLDIRGTLRISGGYAAGQPGILGSTRGDGGVTAENRLRAGFAFISTEGPVVTGKYQTIPSYPVEFNGSTITGLPDDLRGSGGAPGGDYVDSGGGVHAGAAGGAGGGGALIISRGGDINPVTGKIDVSGSAGSPGGYFPNETGKIDVSSGSGAGGAPGGVLWLIDGNALTSAPIAVDGQTFFATHGATPVPTSATQRFDKKTVQRPDSSPNWYSFYAGTGGFNAGAGSSFRVQYIPKQRAPSDDYSLPEAVPALIFRQATEPTDDDAQAAARRFLQLGDYWIDTDNLNKAYLYNGATWEVSYYLGSPYIFRQATEPSNANAQAAVGRNLIPGDYWVDTDNNNKAYRYAGGGVWESSNYTGSPVTFRQASQPDNADAQALAERNLVIGDIWVETDAGNRQWRFNGSTWEAASAARLYDISQDEGVLLLSSQSTHIFSEFWDKPNALERWELLAISGYSNEFAVTTDGANITVGGAVAQLGNASADDRFMLVGKKLIPYDPNRAYRLRARFRKTTGLTGLYCGLIGYAADGVTIVDKTGGTSNLPTNQPTMNGVDGVNPSNFLYAEYDSVWSGHASTGTNGAKSVRLPGKMHSSVRYIRPYFANANGTHAAAVNLDYLVLEDVSVLGTAGRIEDQQALRAANISMSQSTRGSGSITSSDAGATATVSVAAWSFQTGFGTINYNSGSITGLSFSTKYYIYCNDPQTLGGAVTYLATTNYQTPSSNDDYVFVGVVTTVADGGTGGTSGGGGGEWCVCVDSFMPGDWRAGVAQPGHQLLVLREDLAGVEPYHVASAELADADCVRLLAESGIELVCSNSTPLTLADGRVVNVLDGKGELVPVLDCGRFRWERLVEVEPVGMRTVARIHCDGRTYAAGRAMDRYILTHNPAKP